MEADGGTIAAIGNSHYGWYAYGYPGMGPSEQFMSRMVYELFNNGQTRMAQHFAEAKDYYVSSSGSYNSARWLQIVLNLIGDPETEIRTRDPLNLTVDMPDTIGLQYDGYPMKVSYENGTPVKDALVCLQKSDYFSYKHTNSSGYALFNFTSENLDEVNITVTKMDHYPYITNLSLDIKAPWINMTLSEPGTTGDEYEFICNITDEAGIADASIIFNNSLEDLPLLGNDTLWSNNLTIPWNSTEAIPFKIIAMDRSGNFNETVWYNLTVIDDDEPSLIEDRTSEEGTTGDPFKFEIEVDDNIGISRVEVEYEEEPETINKIEMASMDRSTYYHEFNTPLDSIGSRTYRYIIIDTSGNIETIEERSFLVIDDDKPSILDDLSDDIGTTSDLFSFRVNVTDNIGISQVAVEYWLDGWTIPQNVTMDDHGSYFKYELVASSSDLTPYNYIFHVEDTSNNWNSSERGVVGFIDDDPPQFIQDQTQTEVNCGEEIPISVKVSDNIQINSVRFFWSQGDEDEKEVILTHGSGIIWGTTIRTIDTSIEPITYRFKAIDLTGNWNMTENKTITVSDAIKPRLYSKVVPSSVNAGSSLNLSIEVDDNINIRSVSLCWWFGGSDPVNISLEKDGGNYQASIDIPLEAYGTLYIIFKVRDSSDNIFTSERENVHIIEFIPEPEPEPEPETRFPMEGEDLDNDGIDDLWEYYHGLDFSVNDSEEDEDKDGFTNYQEFLANTDPHNPQDHPKEENTDEGVDMVIFLIIVVGLLIMALMGAGALFLILMRNKETKPPEAKMIHPIENDQPTKGHVPHQHVNKPHGDHHSHPLSGDEILHPHHEK
jgi:hypothetical protein